MPLYTYKCKSCEHEFSDIKKMSDMHEPTKQPCGECNETGNIVKTLTGCPAITSSVNTKNKIPHFLKDRFREIKKDRAGTQMDHLI